MKKRIIITISILLILLVGIAVSTNVVKNINNSYAYELKQYTYNPVTILDNKILSGDTYLLPFIFKTPDDTITKAYIEEQFAKSNLTIKTISKDVIGTGTIIETVEDTKKYEVLIYGDVDGDGIVSLGDAQLIIESYLAENEESKIKGVYKTAGNVVNDDNVLELGDAQRIVEFYLGDVETLLSNPPEDDPIDSIEVDVSNVKLVYNYGEELDLSGAKVARVTASGKKCITENLPANSVKGYDKNVAGEQTLNVTYAGLTTNFKVKVLEPVTSLVIDQSIKTENITVGNQAILGVIKQGEGQSEINIDDLKAKVTVAGTDEVANGVVVSYVPRSEVFNDCTDENKDDVIIVATGVEGGIYEVNPYIGDNLENSTAKTEAPVTIEIKDEITVGQINISGTLEVICKENYSETQTPSGQKVISVNRKVEGKTETVYYTLLPISFKDQHGNDKALTLSDFAGYEDSIANKLTVTDNYGLEIPGLDVRLFRKNANGEFVEAGGENVIEYIGFATVHNVNISQMKEDGIVTINYGATNLINSVHANISVKLVK